MNLGKGLQKQIYRNLLTFHYERKSHDISNKIKIYHSEDLQAMQLRLPQKQEETETRYLKRKAPSVSFWNVKVIWFTRKNQERMLKPENIIVLSFDDTAFLISLKYSESWDSVSVFHLIHDTVTDSFLICVSLEQHYSFFDWKSLRTESLRNHLSDMLSLCRSEKCLLNYCKICIDFSPILSFISLKRGGEGSSNFPQYSCWQI